jgi:hypothetical protein
MLSELLCEKRQGATALPCARIGRRFHALSGSVMRLDVLRRLPRLRLEVALPRFTTRTGQCSAQKEWNKTIARVFRMAKEFAFRLLLTRWPNAECIVSPPDKRL